MTETNKKQNTVENLMGVHETVEQRKTAISNLKDRVSKLLEKESPITTTTTTTTTVKPEPVANSTTIGLGSIAEVGAERVAEGVTTEIVKKKKKEQVEEEKLAEREGLIDDYENAEDDDTEDESEKKEEKEEKEEKEGKEGKEEKEEKEEAKEEKEAKGAQGAQGATDPTESDLLSQVESQHHPPDAADKSSIIGTSTTMTLTTITSKTTDKDIDSIDAWENSTLAKLDMYIKSNQVNSKKSDDSTTMSLSHHQKIDGHSFQTSTPPLSEQEKQHSDGLLSTLGKWFANNAMNENKEKEGDDLVDDVDAMDKNSMDIVLQDLRASIRRQAEKQRKEHVKDQDRVSALKEVVQELTDMEHSMNQTEQKIQQAVSNSIVQQQKVVELEEEKEWQAATDELEKNVEELVAKESRIDYESGKVVRNDDKKQEDKKETDDDSSAIKDEGGKGKEKEKAEILGREEEKEGGDNDSDSGGSSSSKRGGGNGEENRESKEESSKQTTKGAPTVLERVEDLAGGLVKTFESEFGGGKETEKKGEGGGGGGGGGGDSGGGGKKEKKDGASNREDSPPFKNVDKATGDIIPAREEGQGDGGELPAAAAAAAAAGSGVFKVVKSMRPPTNIMLHRTEEMNEKKPHDDSLSLAEKKAKEFLEGRNKNSMGKRGDRSRNSKTNERVKKALEKARKARRDADPALIESESGLIFDMAMLLMAAAVGGMFAKRCLLPTPLGFIAGGMLCGPSGMNWIHDVRQMQTLASLGSVFMLFALGVGFPLNEVMRLRKIVITSTFVGQFLIIVIVSQILQVTNFAATLTSSLMVAGGIALSSTSIVLTHINGMEQKAREESNNARSRKRGVEISLHAHGLQRVRSIGLYGNIVLGMVACNEFTSAFFLSIPEVVAYSSSSSSSSLISDSSSSTTTTTTTATTTATEDETSDGTMEHSTSKLFSNWRFAWLCVLGLGVFLTLVGKGPFQCAARCCLDRVARCLNKRMPAQAKYLSTDNQQLLVLTMVAFCLVSSTVSTYIGLSAEMGAFVGGLFVSLVGRVRKRTSALKRNRSLDMESTPLSGGHDIGTPSKLLYEIGGTLASSPSSSSAAVVASVVAPLRNFFSFLYYATVGMALNPIFMFNNIHIILGMTVGMGLVKTIVFALALGATGAPLLTAIT